MAAPGSSSEVTAAPAQARARHDPPAFMSDFSEAQRVAWDSLVQAMFKGSIDNLSNDVTDAGGDPTKLTPQFFDPTTYNGDLVVQPITWNAFPKELLNRFGRQRALAEADRLWPLTAYGSNRFYLQWYDSEIPGSFAASHIPKGANRVFLARSSYRPQVEYCEWHVERHPQTGRITKVTFTSEPPEYWSSMWGGLVPGTDIEFPDGRQQVLDLYRELVSPDVQLEDLISSYDDGWTGVTRGGYNPYNKWNSTHGVAHLAAPPNALSAEIGLGADATLRRTDGANQPVTEPQSLVCCAAYGGVNRNSDPTIGASVNALARLGAMVTLPNPVGLYMDHIDLNGWQTPDGSPPEEWVKIVRGQPGMTERLVVAPPPSSSGDISGLKIGGEPVLFGGQIAECITVKLVGGAYGIGTVRDNLLLPCVNRCCAPEQGGSEIDYVLPDKSLPAGTTEALTPAGGYSHTAAKANFLEAFVAPATPKPSVPPILARRRI